MNIKFLKNVLSLAFIIGSSYANDVEDFVMVHNYTDVPLEAAIYYTKPKVPFSKDIMLGEKQKEQVGETKKSQLVKKIKPRAYVKLPLPQRKLLFDRDVVVINEQRLQKSVPSFSGYKKFLNQEGPLPVSLEIHRKNVGSKIKELYIAYNEAKQLQSYLKEADADRLLQQNKAASVNKNHSASSSLKNKEADADVLLARNKAASVNKDHSASSSLKNNDIEITFVPWKEQLRANTKALSDSKHKSLKALKISGDILHDYIKVKNFIGDSLQIRPQDLVFAYPKLNPSSQQYNNIVIDDSSHWEKALQELKTSEHRDIAVAVHQNVYKVSLDDQVYDKQDWMQSMGDPVVLKRSEIDIPADRAATYDALGGYLALRLKLKQHQLRFFKQSNEGKFKSLPRLNMTPQDEFERIKKEKKGIFLVRKKVNFVEALSEDLTIDSISFKPIEADPVFIPQSVIDTLDIDAIKKIVADAVNIDARDIQLFKRTKDKWVRKLPDLSDNSMSIKSEFEKVSYDGGKIIFGVIKR